MALTLLRHAALDPKNKNRYNGWTDVSISIQDFDKTKISILMQQKFEEIYSSDLLRCQETLVTMGKEEYITDERLREIRFKEEIEGKSFKEIENLPSYDPSILEKKHLWYQYICAESEEVFVSRIISFLRDLPPEKEILICSHSGTILKIASLLGYQKEKIEYLQHIRIENYDRIAR